MNTKRRTQQERRSETQAAVLKSACQLFGLKGYADTSLEDIANDCGVTTRPIYHYFGNKKQLFNAVTEQMELALTQLITDASHLPNQSIMESSWSAFIELCKDSGFRQIVLIDAPNILGRERWATSSVILQVRALLKEFPLGITEQQNELMVRMLVGALAEAALMIAEAEDIDAFADQANDLVLRFISVMKVKK